MYVLIEQDNGFHYDISVYVHQVHLCQHIVTENVVVCVCEISEHLYVVSPPPFLSCIGF